MKTDQVDLREWILATDPEEVSKTIGEATSSNPDSLIESLKLNALLKNNNLDQK